MRTRLALRVAAYLFLALVVVTVNLVAGVFLYLGTSHARKWALEMAVRKLNGVVPGGVDVGGSEGDLTRRVVLHDIVLRDLDRREAVRIERLEVRYTWWALVGRRVQIDFFEIGGATVVSRPLRDGRDNLTTMLARSSGSHPSKTLPVSVAIDTFVLQARVVRQDADIQAVVQASAQLSRGLVARVDRLIVDTLTPMPARLQAQGSAQLGDKMALHHIEVRVTGDTTPLRRRVEKIALTGLARATVSADGPIDDLGISLFAHTTQPPMRLHASGAVHRDRITLASLILAAQFADIHVAGEYHFDKTGHAKVSVHATDLGPLALFGAPPLGGALDLEADVAAEKRLTTRVTGTARNLKIAGEHIGHMTIRAATDDLTGHVRLLAQDLTVEGVRFSTLDLAAKSDAKEVHLGVAGRGPEGVELGLTLDGIARRLGSHVSGLEASIDQLRLRAGGTAWRQVSPAHLSLDFDTRTFALEKLALENHRQRLTLLGRMMGSLVETVELHMQHFDLRQLPAVLSPGRVPPETDLAVDVVGFGGLDHPTGAVRLSCEGPSRTRTGVIHVSVGGDARLRDGRLDGRVAVNIAEQKLNADLSMPFPLRPGQPITGTVHGSLLMNPLLNNALEPVPVAQQVILLYSLGAKLTVEGRLQGTTSDPRVEASVQMARAGAGLSHGELSATATYAEGKAVGSAKLTLSSLPEGGGSGAGVVEVRAELPVDLASRLSGQSRRFVFDRDAPWSGTASVQHVDVYRLPFLASGIVPMVKRGVVDGHGRLGGTFERPRVVFDLDGRDLEVGGVTGVGLHAKGELDGAATGSLTLAVRGNQMLRAGVRVAEGGALAGSVDVDGFNLGHLQLCKGLGGLAHGHMKLAGSLTHPEATARLDVDGLRAGKTAYGHFQLDATVGGRVFVGTLSVGDALHVHLRMPLDVGRVEGGLEASRFQLDVDSDLLPAVRSLSGELDGKMQIAGTTEKPVLSGAVSVRHGMLLLASSATTYHDLSAQLAFRDNTLSIGQLQAGAGLGGQLTGEGSIAIRGWGVDLASGKIRLRHYPLQWASVAAVVDAELEAHGERKRGGFVTRVALAGVDLDLKDDVVGLIPTAHLEDVTAARARPEPVANPFDGKPATHANGDLLYIEGPIHVRSAELDAKLDADVQIRLGGDNPPAKGTLTVEHGTAQLFGQSYDLAGQLAFGNLAQPDVSLRLTRSDGGRRIGVDLGGSVRQPSVACWSDPVASKTSVAAAITGGVSLDTKGLWEKTRGPISRAIGRSLLRCFTETARPRTR